MTTRINVTSSHTVNPQHGLNPIDLAAAIIVKLPSLVEPFISAEKFASVSCNEIHAGQRGLDTLQLVEIVLDIKSYEPSIRQTLHQSVRDLVQSECTLAGVEQKPHIALKVRAPLTSNSPELVESIESNFKTYFIEDVGEGERRKRARIFPFSQLRKGDHMLTGFLVLWIPRPGKRIAQMKRHLRVSPVIIRLFTPLQSSRPYSLVRMSWLLQH